jgi:hypothetical protein
MEQIKAEEKGNLIASAIKMDKKLPYVGRLRKLTQQPDFRKTETVYEWVHVSCSFWASRNLV